MQVQIGAFCPDDPAVEHGVNIVRPALEGPDPISPGVGNIREIRLLFLRGKGKDEVVNEGDAAVRAEGVADEAPTSGWKNIQGWSSTESSFEYAYYDFEYGWIPRNKDDKGVVNAVHEFVW